MIKKRLTKSKLRKYDRKKMRNTLEGGSVRYIVFKERGTWYAVGLEFNIVENGKTPHEALRWLFEAVTGYIESARKSKSDIMALNQKIDPEYEAMWNALERGKEATASIFSFGEMNIGKGKSLAYV